MERGKGSLVEEFGSLERHNGLPDGREIKFPIINPVRNSSGALNPAGIILKPNPAAEQQGIISNGVNSKEGGKCIH